MKILLELPTWIGDTIMMTPALENLLSNFDNPKLTLLGSSNSIDLLRSHPKVIESFVLKKNYSSIIKLASNIGKFDIFFSFRSSQRSSLLKLIIKSKKKYQYNYRKFNDHHQVEKFNNFINQSLKLNLIAGPLAIYPGIEISNSSKRLPMLGINPGASYGSAKRWYPNEFSTVALNLSKRYDIAIIGGPNEIDIALEIEKSLVKKGVSNYKNFVGKTSISELISLISGFDLLITGDSGPMHIAAYYKIPTVSIFGPTKDYETSQWRNEKSSILKKKLVCQPCMKRVCPLQHHNCMKQIKAQDVIEEVRLLNL